MKTLTKLASTCWLGLAVIAGTFGLATTVHALEPTAYVQLQELAIENAGTYQKYYVSSKTGSWGFANCTAANGNWLSFLSTNPAAKDWVALLLTAKATGQTVLIYVDACSTLNVTQINLR